MTECGAHTSFYTEEGRCSFCSYYLSRRYQEPSIGWLETVLSTITNEMEERILLGSSSKPHESSSVHLHDESSVLHNLLKRRDLGTSVPKLSSLSGEMVKAEVSFGQWCYELQT